jgi:PAS domain S-box-containing protein
MRGSFETSNSVTALLRSRAHRFASTLASLSSSDGRLLVILSVLLTGVVVALGVLILKQGSEQTWVEHTLIVENHLSNLWSALQDAETGQRGYLLTDDAAYLDNFARGAATTEIELKAVASSTTDNPTQQQAIAKLKPIIEQRLAVIREVTAIYRSGDRQRAIALLHTSGQTLMDEARLLITGMRAEEERLLATRQAQASSSAVALRIAFAAALAFLILTCLVIMKDYRERLRRAQANQLALEATNRQLTAAAETDQQFRTLVQGIADSALYMLDPQGRVSSWNSGARRIKGYAEEEILGQHFSQFFTKEDRSNGLPQRELEITRREGKYEGEEWRVRKDGVRFLASVHLNAIHDDNGMLIGFAKITRDITDRRAAQAQLQSTQEQLAQSQKMEAIGHLAGGIAHDFNNMLAVVVSSFELVRRKLARGEHDVDAIITAGIDGARRAASLTHRLLAFARRQPLSPQPIDVNRLVGGMSELLNRTLGEDIRIETVLAAGVWTTYADPSQLENSILNLAANARDAMPSGGKLTVETANVHLDDAYAGSFTDVPAGQYVLVAVTDTGTGMKPETLAKAFDPFFTTKPEGKGTGLGLAQVFGFTKQTGGHARIYSELGEGTTVKLYLPRYTGVDEVKEKAPMRALSAAKPHETVLVVEDDERVRRMAVASLRDLGYTVFEADGGARGLQILDAHPEVLVLFTDIVMPDMNGRKLADEAQRRRPELKVIFTTGFTSNAVVHGGIVDLGVNILQKPFTIEDLARKIRQVLD